MHHVSTFNECSSCGALFQELKRRFIMRQPKPKKTSSRGKNNFFNRGKSVNAECSEVTVKIFAAKDLSLFYTILPETLAIRISTSLNPLWSKCLESNLHDVICSLQTLRHWFLICRNTSLGTMEGRMIKFQYACVEVWFQTTNTRVSRAHLRHNNPAGIRVLRKYFYVPNSYYSANCLKICTTSRI